MSYFGFLTVMRRLLRRTIYFCIALHEFKSGTLNADSIVIFERVFPLFSCKIDGFRSKDTYRFSNIMDRPHQQD